MDPSTPVLVGAGVVRQRAADPATSREAVELMVEAVERALDDAGARGLRSRIGLVLVPKGIWAYADPGRLVADRFGLGASAARTVLAEVGVLQTTLVARAAAAIAAYEVEVAVVVGGEAKHRSLTAVRLGVEATEDVQVEAAPDELLVPAGEIISGLEIGRGLAVPAHQYAIVDSALAHAAGRSPGEHTRVLGGLWSRFNDVAVSNPDAWDAEPLTAEQIADATAPGNRMVAVPYTRRLCSQWNVDQAVALVLCSAEVAAGLGVAPERWVFPHAVVESNTMIPLPARRDLHRCPAFVALGDRLRAVAGVEPADVAHLDLYSCFPAAVQVQAGELGIDLGRQLTVTGGMTFAGGPLNSYALHAIAAMARVLRDDPRSLGLVTAVSGMLTKQGLVLLSGEPAATGFRCEDVSDEARRLTATCPVVECIDGPAVVDGHTVAYAGAAPAQAMAVLTSPRGDRTVATSTDPALVTSMATHDWCGREVHAAGATFG